jgi:hypothetical protein
MRELRGSYQVRAAGRDPTKAAVHASINGLVASEILVDVAVQGEASDRMQELHQLEFDQFCFCSSSKVIGKCGWAEQGASIKRQDAATT